MHLFRAKHFRVCRTPNRDQRPRVHAIGYTEACCLYCLMQPSRLLQLRSLRSPDQWRNSGLVRGLPGPTPTQARNRNGREAQREPVSLFDELFPAEREQQQRTATHVASRDDIQIPRLPLTDIEHMGPFADSHGSSKEHKQKLTRKAAQGSVKQWNPAILVFQRASKSLNEADFRRIAPKGLHIEEWTGPGDILKGMDFHSSLFTVP